MAVVSDDTLLLFSQRGDRVFARYAGGAVERGWLVGSLTENSLVFPYAQCEATGDVHGGRSVCDVQRLPTGRTRIIERFEWSTRVGAGENVFDEIA